MIHMLSRFDLTEGAEIERFTKDYKAFAEEMRARGLILGTGPVGQRHADTPMDTDGDWGQRYYVIMSFADRSKLDQAYAFIETADLSETLHHRAIIKVLRNAVFTCWEDLS